MVFSKLAGGAVAFFLAGALSILQWDFLTRRKMEKDDEWKINLDKLLGPPRDYRSGRQIPTHVCGPTLYIHEVTSPSFKGLRDAGRKVRRPDLTFGNLLITMFQRSIFLIFEM